MIGFEINWSYVCLVIVLMHCNVQNFRLKDIAFAVKAQLVVSHLQDGCRAKDVLFIYVEKYVEIISSVLGEIE